MNPDRSRFLQALFNPGEQTCFALTTYDTAIEPVARPDRIWFSINPLHPQLDMEGKSNTGRRADKNVISFRNFLIEIDEMPLNEQLSYVYSRLKPTTVVYSGKKSYHFIFALTESLTDGEEYAHWARRLHRMFEGVADKTTKNCSRLSRLPGVIRPDTQKEQLLIDIHEKYSIEELNKLLPEVDKVYYTEAVNKDSVLDRYLFIIEDPDYAVSIIGGRNNTFYQMGCRQRDLEYDDERAFSDLEIVYGLLRNKQNFSIREARGALESGRKSKNRNKQR